MAEQEKEEDLLKNLQEKNLELSLFKARKIFLWSDVNDESAKAVDNQQNQATGEQNRKQLPGGGGVCRSHGRGPVVRLSTETG